MMTVPTKYLMITVWIRHNNNCLWSIIIIITKLSKVFQSIQDIYFLQLNKRIELLILCKLIRVHFYCTSQTPSECVQHFLVCKIVLSQNLLQQATHYANRYVARPQIAWYLKIDLLVFPRQYSRTFFKTVYCYHVNILWRSVHRKNVPGYDSKIMLVQCFMKNQLVLRLGYTWSLPLGTAFSALPTEDPSLWVLP